LTGACLITDNSEAWEKEDAEAIRDELAELHASRERLVLAADAERRDVEQ
jgi:hypothetical protein